MRQLLFIFSFLLMLTSCGSDDLSNTRAYVEGKIGTENISFDEINIFIKSENKVVAQTIPTSSGNFVLSGPLFSEGFSVHFNEKIKSFSASKSNCSISEDSLSIIVPEDVSYIVFSEVKLKK